MKKDIELIKIKTEFFGKGYYEGLKACPASYQKGREDMRKEVDNNIGQLGQWLNELPKGHFVTSWEIAQWLFPEKSSKKSIRKERSIEISQCPSCLSMTKTLKGNGKNKFCGKCHALKDNKPCLKSVIFKGKSSKDPKVAFVKMMESGARFVYSVTVGGKTIKAKKMKQIPGNCPYCDTERGRPGGWGMSPSGWDDMKRRHDEGHPEKDMTTSFSFPFQKKLIKKHANKPLIV